jgi:hypothetical protein
MQKFQLCPYKNNYDIKSINKRRSKAFILPNENNEHLCRLIGNDFSKCTQIDNIAIHYNSRLRAKCTCSQKLVNGISKQKIDNYSAL